jgi:hypothetical protein
LRPKRSNHSPPRLRRQRPRASRPYANRAIP